MAQKNRPVRKEDDADHRLRRAFDEKRAQFKKPPKPMYDSWNLPEENSVKPPNSQAGKGPKGYKRSDERIREDACEALLVHPEIDATDIEVLVNDGVVTLHGNVESRLAKRMTEDLIENISGVSGVVNEIHSRNHTSSQKNASNGKKFKKTDHRDH